MNHSIGMVLKKMDMGFCGERVSFIHSINTADNMPELIAELERLSEDKITVNLFTRNQLQRFAEVRGNPYLYYTIIDGGQNIGIVNRKKLLNELKR